MNSQRLADSAMLSTAQHAPNQLNETLSNSNVLTLSFQPSRVDGLFIGLSFTNCSQKDFQFPISTAESEKAKTFRIARFVSQKLSG